MLADCTDTECILSYVHAGVRGYLCKAIDLSMLAVAVPAVARGDLYLSSSVADDVLRRLVHYRNPASSCVLTAREQDVLRLLAQGYDDVDIAGMLCISIGTVKLHLAHIFEKLNLRKRSQIVAWAWQHGLVERQS
jgi:DNA-binding NarL/FixJ family response regulator